MNNYEQYLWELYHKVENDFTDPYNGELRHELLKDVMALINKVHKYQEVQE